MFTETFYWLTWRRVVTGLLVLLVLSALVVVFQILLEKKGIEDQIRADVRAAGQASGIGFDRIVNYGPINRDSSGHVISALGDFRGLFTTAKATVRVPEQPEGATCTKAPGGEGIFWLHTTYQVTYNCSIPAAHPYDGPAILYFTGAP